MTAVHDDGLGGFRGNGVDSREHARERDVQRSRHMASGKLAGRSHVEHDGRIATIDALEERGG
jgi:hypothetical protein